MTWHLIITKSAAFYLVREVTPGRVYTKADDCYFIHRAKWDTKHYNKSSIRNLNIYLIIRNVSFAPESTHEEIYSALKKQGKLSQTIINKVEGK